jgi:hypothetical protein
MDLYFVRFRPIYDVQCYNNTNNCINAYIFISTLLWLVMKEWLQFMTQPTR